VRHQTRAAIEKLNFLLKLDKNRWQQDWNIELADPNRVDEFCQVYERLYEVDEKFALMTLIISSYDDFISEQGDSPELEKRIAQLILTQWELHVDTIHYWALISQPEIEDGFAVTPFMRKILQQQKSNAQGK